MSSPRPRGPTFHGWQAWGPDGRIPAVLDGPRRPDELWRDPVRALGADQRALRAHVRDRGRAALPQRSLLPHLDAHGCLLRLLAARLPLALPGALRPDLDRRAPPLRLQPPEPAEEGPVRVHGRRGAPRC